jgi:hypothetical protein
VNDRASDRTEMAGQPPDDPTPTPAQRLALVRAFQSRALGRLNPLAANLEVISGDLMLFAHRLAASVQADLAEAGIPRRATRSYSGTRKSTSNSSGRSTAWHRSNASPPLEGRLLSRAALWRPRPGSWLRWPTARATT